MERPRVLIVDDERGVRESLRMILKDRAELFAAESGEEALELLEQHPVDVVLLDILMPGIDGIETLEKIKTAEPSPQVIMLTATKTVKTAVQAMKLGAYDYLTKPFDLDELTLQVDRAFETAALQEEVRSLRSEVGRRYRFDDIIGAAGSMQPVLDTVRRVAAIKTTILITGESGTGKEVIARAIHYNSPRAHRPLVTLNCAAIPDSLLESELFGHERGAFTDAHARKPGQFEKAHRGSIFLDEIGEMNPATQAKILRVLEQSTFTRVGGTDEIEVDVRVIAATNRDLKKAMDDGTFRPDLYFRLNVVALHLPPLRERTSDIPLLVRHFVARKSSELGVPAKPFSDEAMSCLMRYRWPGNVRELENVVERALVLSTGETLDVSDLPPDVAGRAAPSSSPSVAVPALDASVAAGKTLGDAVDELERKLIRQALADANYNQTRAAELLGTTRRILKYKMNKLEIRDGAPPGNG